MSIQSPLKNKEIKCNDERQGKHPHSISKQEIDNDKKLILSKLRSEEGVT